MSTTRSDAAMHPQGIAFCSLATAGYRQQALGCLASLRRWHPQSTVVLLDVDDAGGAPPAGLRTLSARDCLPPAQLAAMRARYSPAELCFALKPFLIAALLREGAEQVHYLDGDCRVYGGLDPLLHDLAGADLLLTPHALTPIPDDGRTPAALTVLRGGVFNGGYIGVRNTAEGRRFVGWLGDMTRTQARNEPAQGMCGDQRWLDLAPALFPGLAICRRPEANVAYWNLHERALSQDQAQGYRVNGQPLLFFHFSGYRSERPLELSTHQNRHAVTPGSALHALLAGYRQQLPAPPETPRSLLARLRHAR